MRLLSEERDGMPLNALSSKNSREWKARALEHRTLFNVQFQIGRRILLFPAWLLRFARYQRRTASTRLRESSPSLSVRTRSASME